MSIKATCHCGAQFMAKPELAGRIVKCPTCGQSFQVPKPVPAAPAVNQSTFPVACPCGRTYQVQLAMAGRPVRCKACGQQFIIPQAPAAMRQTPIAPAPAPDPFAGTGPLDNLGDLSSFGYPAANTYASQPLASSNFGVAGSVARRKPSATKVKSSTVISIVLSSLVVLAIIGIAIGTFVFFPFGPGYSSPQAVWEAQKTATEKEDWKTLYNTLTPESRKQLVGLLAWSSRMLAIGDEGMAAIMKEHGVETPTSPPDVSSPAGLGELFSQMQQQSESAADSIKDKEAFFVDTMNHFAAKREEMQATIGDEQMTMMNASQALKDVVIEGDSAYGTQTVTVMGRSTDVPIEFRKIDGGWLIHASMSPGRPRGSSASS